MKMMMGSKREVVRRADTAAGIGALPPLGLPVCCPAATPGGQKGLCSLHTPAQRDGGGGGGGRSG